MDFTNLSTHDIIYLSISALLICFVLFGIFLMSKVKKSLAESHLENLVIRKEDGRVGWLRVTPTIYGFAIEFYPRTKSGKMSKLASGYVGNSVEKYFEPYKENK